MSAQEQKDRLKGSQAATSDPALEQEFLYSAGSKEQTAFDVFLRHTTQKERTAATLAGMMLNGEQEELRMLDIGTGEGALHVHLLKNIRNLRPFTILDFTFIEPKPNHVENLKGVIKAFQTTQPGGYAGRVIKGEWEEVQKELLGQTFDRILCSHTIYHFAPDKFDEYFAQMVSFLSPQGRLHVVARRKDDVYNFIRNHFFLATSRSFNELTIDDARPSLQRIGAKYDLRYAEETSLAQVRLPFASAPHDAQQIVGFFLRTPWEEMPEAVQKKIMEYLGEGDPILEQRDGIIELSKNHV